MNYFFAVLTKYATFSGRARRSEYWYFAFTFNDGPSDEPVTFKEVLQLSDEDITLVRDVIRNFQRTGNSLIVYKLAMRIQEHLSITCPPELNDYEFLELVLKDYDKLVI